MSKPASSSGQKSTLKPLFSGIALLSIALAAVACSSSSETDVASSSEAALHVGPNPLDTCGEAFNGTACGHAFYQGADLGAGFCWQHACVYFGCIVTGPAGAFDSFAPGETNPKNPCEVCAVDAPGKNQELDAPLWNRGSFAGTEDGKACGDGVTQMCSGGSCKGTCLIDGVRYYDGATHGGDCEVCDVTTNPTAWSTGGCSQDWGTGG